jgi:hypothetical protein
MRICVDINQVISLTKLRKNYNTYEAKRALAASYDMFVADEKIYSFLPALLGKAFYKLKKYDASCTRLRTSSIRLLTDTMLSVCNFCPDNQSLSDWKAAKI